MIINIFYFFEILLICIYFTKFNFYANYNDHLFINLFYNNIKNLVLLLNKSKFIRCSLFSIFVIYIKVFYSQKISCFNIICWLYNVQNLNSKKCNSYSKFFILILGKIEIYIWFIIIKWRNFVFYIKYLLFINLLNYLELIIINFKNWNNKNY